MSYFYGTIDLAAKYLEVPEQWVIDNLRQLGWIDENNLATEEAKRADAVWPLLITDLDTGDLVEVAQLTIPGMSRLRELCDQ